MSRFDAVAIVIEILLAVFDVVGIIGSYQHGLLIPLIAFSWSAGIVTMGLLVVAFSAISRRRAERAVEQMHRSWCGDVYHGD